MRIETGLASGLDTAQLVKDLMKAERARVDKLYQQKKLIQWRQELYHEMNKNFANFILDTKKEFGLTQTTSTGVILNKSVSSLNWVKKATASSTAYADVEARADAVQGSYEVTVTSVAKGVTFASKESLGTLADLKTQFGLGDSDVIEFTIANKDGNPEHSHTFTYSGADLTSKTIQDVVKDINTISDEKNLGVKAIYDATNSRFFLQTKATGAANGFKVIENAGSGNVINFMTGTSGGEPINKLKLVLENDTTYSGADAVINFAGAEGITASSNNITVNGINFNVKALGTFTVDVTTDVDAVYNKIKTFVDKYNEMLDRVGTELSEKRYRDYLPLTDEQKEAMSEKEIELWEEKAKSGLLKGDMILERTVQTMRLGMYQEVAGVQGIYKQLTQIGISTQGYVSGSVGGKLIIDETKLKEAIAKDVDSVLELLFKEPSDELKYKSESSMTGAEIAQKRNESGLVSRLYDNIVAGMKEIVYKAGAGDNAELYRKVNSSIMIDFVVKYSSISLLDKEELQFAKKIDEMNEYLTRTEERYWKKFTALEKALSRMNAQSAWLAQQFGQSGP